MGKDDGATDDITDDYLVELLKSDRRKLLSNSKSRNQAVKPNIRFLRNIIRETDNHNAALLAKEAVESKSKFDNLRHKRFTYESEDNNELLSNSHRQKRARYDSDSADDRDRRRERIKSKEKSKSSRHKHERTDKSGRPEKPERSDRDRDRERRSSRRSESPKRKTTHGPSSKRHHYQSKSFDKRLSRYLSPSSDETRRIKKKSRDSKGRRDKTRNRSQPSDSKKTDETESDPLEDLIGPLPPKHSKEPPVVRKGRGTFGMESRFSNDYDPVQDWTLHSDQGDDDVDDWEEALEILKDRQRMKQQGADRLRQAGFTEQQVSKWEKGDEKSEEDVKWTKKGESREWDRGKIIDDDGNVTLKPEWGRLI